MRAPVRKPSAPAITASVMTTLRPNRISAALLRDAVRMAATRLAWIEAHARPFGPAAVAISLAGRRCGERAASNVVKARLSGLAARGEACGRQAALARRLPCQITANSAAASCSVKLADCTKILWSAGSRDSATVRSGAAAAGSTRTRRDTGHRLQACRRRRRRPARNRPLPDRRPIAGAGGIRGGVVDAHGGERGRAGGDLVAGIARDETGPGGADGAAKKAPAVATGTATARASSETRCVRVIDVPRARGKSARSPEG